MNKQLTGALSLVLLSLFAGPRAEAGGPTSHLGQASRALQHIDDPLFKARLLIHGNAYLNGANFPDTFNILALPAPYVPVLSFYTADEVHSAHFLSKYAEFVQAAPLDDQLLAHFMGTLAHVVGDQRFDRYFLTRVTRECFPEQYVGSAPAYAQVYTDQDLDWRKAPLRLNPLNGILTPFLPTVPWEVGHKSLPPFVPQSVLERAFPGRTTIWYPHLQEGVTVAFDYILAEPALYSFAGPPCVYAEDTWASGLGGVDDGGVAIAQYINRAWEILQSGGLPYFDEYGTWPNNELRISDAWAATPAKADYGSWVVGRSGISQLELEDDRVVALEQQQGPQGTVETLWQLDGQVEGAWTPLFTTSAGIAQLELEGDRSGVLLGSGQLQTHTGSGPWQPVLRGVSRFQLDGDRTAALVRGELLVQDGGPAGAWLPLTLPADDVPGTKSVVDFQVAGERVAVLTRQDVSSNGQALTVSKLMMTEGIGARLQWFHLWSEKHLAGQGSSVSFRLDGDRAAVLVGDQLYAREGALAPDVFAWSLQRTGVADFQLKGDCMAALDVDGQLSLEKDDLLGPWHTIAFDVSAFELEGYNAYWAQADPWLAYTTADGSLRTNRKTDVLSGATLPVSSEHFPPVAGVTATAFRLEKTVPYAAPQGIQGEIKLEDRLAVLVGGTVYVKELPRFAANVPPPIELTRHQGLAGSHWVKLEWDHTKAGPNDYVALYDRSPVEAGPNGYLLGQWQWATKGPSWVSLKQWAAGYYMAYVKEDQFGNRTIAYVSAPTLSSVAGLQADRYQGPLFSWVRLNWTATDPGFRDYVALYDQDPLVAGPDGYLTGQWQWATKGPSWVSSKLYSAGYYAAYVQEDAQGNRTILDTMGPTVATPPAATASVWLTKQKYLFTERVVLNWSAANVGSKDYVALFNQDPDLAGPNGYLTLQWQWASKGPSWVSNTQWGPGYWVAYVHEDTQGNRTIIAKAGPTQP